MKVKQLGKLFLGVILAAGCLSAAVTAADREWTGNEWNLSESEMTQVENLKIGREDARSSFFPFADEEAALDSQQIGEKRNLEDAWYQSLNTEAGQTWKFYYVSYPGARALRPDNDNIMNPDYDDSEWDEITVPKSWEASYNEDGTFKYNPPQYSNTSYPWITQDSNPTAPNAPIEFNPVGFYRTKVNVDSSFKGRSVFLTFEGVESAFYLWVNGHQVGYSADSFTSKEFKIDEYLNFDGNDTIAVEVFKWSSGSWFEDQDMLTLAGIFRSVYLTSKDSVEIRDFTINTTKTGNGTDPDVDYNDFNFELYASIRDLGADEEKLKDLQVSVDLYDPEGKIVSQNALENAELKKKVNSGEFTGTDSLGRSMATVKLSATVKNPLKWSAESPNLYKALITLRDASGELIETTAYRFGFRMIEIKNENQSDAQMILNGQPLLIKGVNLHETNYETGRAMTYELIFKDITMMKQYNFNAIRMSHYSHDFRYYDLADEMGMYICDEANIETHGNRSIPSNNSNYLPAVLDRLSSMFYRSKNFPSVIILSLGNEAGSGTVFGEMNKWLKGNYTGTPNFYVDENLKGDLQGRPVHYEGDNDNADIKSNMYPSVSEVKNNSNVNKPYVLCEYSHAMGTSGGYYQQYWDVFESKDNIQGGWIWDWVDQGMKTYVEPEAFPAQTSLGWQGGNFVSQDSYETQVKPTGGPDCIVATGTGGAEGEYALNGAAYAETTPDVLNFNGSFTIEVWVNPADTSTSSRTIVAKGDKQYKLQTVNGKIQFNTYCNGWNELNYEYDQETWANQWHHIVVTYDAETKTASLYLDDMSEAKLVTAFSKANEDGTFSKSTANFGIGYDSDNAGKRDWQGLLDNVRVYNRALSAKELSEQHDPADEDVIYWEDFENGLVGEETDISNKIYTMTSQDSLGTKINLINNSILKEGSGVSGDTDDKALQGIAVAKNTPDELDINGTFTLEAWVYPTGESGQRVIIAKGDTQYVLRTQAGQLCLQTYSEKGWNQLLYQYDDSWLGNWHHVAATYDAETKTAKMYIDDMSKPVAEKVFSNVYEDGTFEKNGESFAVGRETNNTGRDWQGLLDNVRVYNKALSAEELQNDSRTAQDEGVVFWQDFNEETEATLPVVSEGYIGFGGDWGDSPNSSNFCANGIVSAERIPHGAMLELKRVHQDYVMEVENISSSQAEVEIRSRALFTNASAYNFVWELKEDGVTIRKGTQELDIAPLETKTIHIGYDEITPQNGKQYYLTMKFVLKSDLAWAKAGHEISGAQAELDFEAELVPKGLDDLPELTYTETEDTYEITGKDFQMTFDRTKGTIRSLVYKGTELFAQDDLNGPEPNFWRAPTDGDRLSNISTTWRYAGKKRKDITTEIEELYSKALKIDVKGNLAPSTGAASYSMTFTVYGDGQIMVENSVTPEGFSSSDVIPVVGNEMQLDTQFENMTWFGRGSDQEGLFSESFADRYAQQFIDLYEDQVENQFIPYIRNQTFGNKMDVSWAAFTNAQGTGLVISSVGELLNINAQHYTQEELTSFGTKHPYESQRTDNVVVNLDYKNMAVGYDPSWLSKGWYESEDVIRPTQTFTYQYKLSPVEGFTAEKAFETSRQSYVLEVTNTEKESAARVMLEIVYCAYKELDTSAYTEESSAALTGALERAKAIIDQEDAEETAVISAAEAVLEAAGGLLYDTSKLEDAAATAKERAEEAEKAASAAEQAAQAANTVAEAAKKKAEESEQAAQLAKQAADMAKEAADAAQEKAEQAEKAAEEAKEELEEVKNQAEKQQKELEEAQKQIEEQQAALEEAQRQIGEQQAALEEAQKQAAQAEQAAQAAREAAEAAQAKAEAAAQAALEAAQKQTNTTPVKAEEPIQTIQEGKIYDSGDYYYKVTSVANQTVEVTGIKEDNITKVRVYNKVTLGGKSYQVTAVADSAFKNNKKITSAVIGKNVEVIGNNAFSGCTKLKKATVKSTKLTKIGSKVFFNCKKLKDITIKSKMLKKVGANTFKGINKKAVIKVPAAKYKTYAKLLAKKGQGNMVKIKK